MERLANLKVGTRLIAAFVLVAAVSAIVGAVGIVNMHKISSAANQLYANQLLGVSYIKDANVDLIDVSLKMHSMLLATNAEQRSKAQAEMEKSAA